MKKLTSVLSALSVFTLLSGCSSSSTPVLPGTVPLLQTISGVTHNLRGTYSTGCHANGAASAIESFVISGSIWAYTSTDFTDGACGVNPVVGTIVGNIAVNGAVSAITGWVDGAGTTATSPDAADASAPIGNADFTPLSYEVTAVTGSFVGSVAVSDVVPLFYVVDDTVAKAILYRDFDYAAGNINARTIDPFIKL